jgi:hypothetical protein
MTRETIEARMVTLIEELKKAEEELGKLRPRVQYLEVVMTRLDGAVTVLRELLDTDSAPLPCAQDADEVRNGWATVAS